MKQLLRIEEIPQCQFFSPYLIYDTISIFDKSEGAFTPRRRTTGISYDMNGAIIIAFAICSKQDIYSKVKIRHKIQGRIIQIIHALHNPQNNSKHMLNTEHAYYFDSLETYNEFVEASTAFTSAFAAPYKMIQEGKDKEGLFKYNLDTVRDDMANFYWHKNFIAQTYGSFMNSFDNINIQVEQNNEIEGVTI